MPEALREKPRERRGKIFLTIRNSREISRHMDNLGAFISGLELGNWLPDSARPDTMRASYRFVAGADRVIGKQIHRFTISFRGRALAPEVAGKPLIAIEVGEPVRCSGGSPEDTQCSVVRFTAPGFERAAGDLMSGACSDFLTARVTRYFREDLLLLALNELRTSYLRNNYGALRTYGPEGDREAHRKALGAAARYSTVIDGLERIVDLGVRKEKERRWKRAYAAFLRKSGN
jgi:hypothetical protein